MKYIKSCVAVIIAISTAIVSTIVVNSASLDTPDKVNRAIKGALSYRFGDFSPNNINDYLKELSKNAGDYSSDWYYIAMSRYGINCDHKESINSLKSVVDDFYKNGLENTKVTDMQRVALALLSCTSDITDVNGHNFLADCTYNRENYAPLDKQGVNSLAFALILLDSKDFSVPNSAKLSRNDILEKILQKELPNGGFSIVGNAPDVDATAITLQSLAPYYNNSKVKPVIDRALNYISKVQQTTGAFKSFGKENAESTAQVIIALTSLNIDILTDKRFIKNGNTALDGLMSFLMEDGGFCHIQGYTSNNMATYQSLCALVSYYRYLNKQTGFFSFSKKDVSQQNTEISPVNKPSSKKTSLSKTDKKANNSEGNVPATETIESDTKEIKTKKNTQSPKSNSTESKSTETVSIETVNEYPTAIIDSQYEKNQKYYSINRDKTMVSEKTGTPIEIIYVFLIIMVAYLILLYIKTRGIK